MGAVVSTQEYMGRLGNCNVAVAFRIYCLHKNHPICVNVSLFMLAKPVAKLAMPAGSCIAWSMEFSPMVKCLYPNKVYGVTIPFQRFSLKQGVESMCQEAYLLISSPLSLMRSELELIASSFIRSS